VARRTAFIVATRFLTAFCTFSKAHLDLAHTLA